MIVRLSFCQGQIGKKKFHKLQFMYFNMYIIYVYICVLYIYIYIYSFRVNFKNNVLITVLKKHMTGPYALGSE